MAPFDPALGMVQPPARTAGVAAAMRRPPVARSALVLTIVLLSVRSVQRWLGGSSALEAGPAHEAAAGRRRPVDDLHGQRRKSPWRGTADDAGAVPGVELGLVARAAEPFRLGRPEGDVAARVRAHAGVGDDPVGGVATRLLGQVGGSEPNEQDLVETRPVADHAGGG